MEFYLNRQEEYFRVADEPLYSSCLLGGIKSYISSIPLAIQNLAIESDNRKKREISFVKRWNYYEKNIKIEMYGYE